MEMELDQDDLMRILPDDVLAHVLAHLEPRWLAASRCVCKAWRVVIDSYRLLRPDLLPLSLGGIYINFNEMYHSLFLSRPSTGPSISGLFTDYTPDNNMVHDHCNGLLLLSSGIANPATRQWVPLPPPPPQNDVYLFDSYLVFDPTISSYFEIFEIPRIPYITLDMLDPMSKSLQWPPSPIVLTVFSSRTRQWEERLFVRRSEAACTVADMALAFPYEKYDGVYWQGALYVYCRGDFFMRMSLSDNTYQVIRPPITTEISVPKSHFLGRSKKGVYYALIDGHNKHRLRVWFLNESRGHITWELKHDKDISFMLKCQGNYMQNDGPWTAHFFDYVQDYHPNDNQREITPMNKFEWDSDDDNILDTENKNEGWCGRYPTILGFHPFKEVIFMNQEMDRGFAYHFNSSKVQYLGSTFPESYKELHIEYICGSFMYTPYRGAF
uniref:F-box domain-containing protein n=1 Tax=Leersia perrieri TaxID=77586 RepID=A0A0D9VXE1_9ORYZ